MFRQWLLKFVPIRADWVLLNHNREIAVHIPSRTYWQAVEEKELLEVTFGPLRLKLGNA